MQRLYAFLLWCFITRCTAENVGKLKFCSDLYCGDNPGAGVCGLREEGGGIKLRLFENECELMKYGCEVEDEKAYGLINIDYCNQAFSPENVKTEDTKTDFDKFDCFDIDCSYPTDSKEVCAIEQDRTGFKVRLFLDKCKLVKYNCINKTNFTITDYQICKGVDVSEDIKMNKIKPRVKVTRRAPNIIVVDANMFNFNNNINETINTFFAATHVLDIPVDEMNKHVNETARRMLIDIFGPQVVFKPWITIPKNISQDYYHLPTLSSCYHKCPMKCPDTYAPVCGQPGQVAREPSIMFQNHCYMDAAQCKMRWDDKSDTAESSSYIESTFMFCLGDALSTMFRFLPLVRTLQHMGRLKKKGYFRYRIRNMRFVNNMLLREPNLMGK